MAIGVCYGVLQKQEKSWDFVLQVGKYAMLQLVIKKALHQGTIGFKKF